MLRGLGVLLASCLLCSGANQAAIHGQVLDPHGALLPDAQIEAHRVGSKQVWRVRSDAAGHFVIAALPKGVYRLEVSRQGFLKVSLPVQLKGKNVSIPPVMLNVAPQQVGCDGGGICL